MKDRQEDTLQNTETDRQIILRIGRQTYIERDGKIDRKKAGIESMPYRQIFGRIQVDHEERA